MLPDADKLGQIQALSEFLRSNFGARPRGMWLAERVWEPQLPKIAAPGRRRVRGPGRRALRAGRSRARGASAAYYLTEEQGATLAVFPISQQLRYLVPFAEPAETVRYLDERRGRRGDALRRRREVRRVARHAPAGLRRGLARALLRRAIGSAGHHAVDLFGLPRRGAGDGTRVPADGLLFRDGRVGAARRPGRGARRGAAAALRRCPTASGWCGCCAGGFWRNFLVKYPEMGDAYWRMLRSPRGSPRRSRSARTTRGSRRRGKTSGAARATTPTGTVSLEDRTCRISADPWGARSWRRSDGSTRRWAPRHCPGSTTTWTATVARRSRCGRPSWRSRYVPRQAAR